ncbi:MAG TPA: selenoneine biosynthesis selenosugar synthase SenB [Terriglobia bacterium]|nr:selenoneine biosynthesis selenosugar synthase SenB [Terriglobia bacterium]
MRIGIITPARAHSRHGNRVTALRWQNILRELGHQVTIAQNYYGGRYDLLVALHARRSHSSILRFHTEHSGAPLIVALTGTDLYHDLGQSRRAQESLELATRLIVLQPKALQKLRPQLRRKARVIFQSVAMKPKADRGESLSNRTRRTFDVCVAGHLRSVKDPFRAALAARLVPLESRILILHAGRAMTQTYEARTRAEMKLNPRYRWLGEVSRERVFHLLRCCKLFVLSSRLEGGANALGEAIAAGLPILASRIPGNVGILGKNYPGFFNVGDTKGLAKLLSRAETDSTFRAELKTRCKKLASLFKPSREKAAWAKLLADLGR